MKKIEKELKEEYLRSIPSGNKDEVKKYLYFNNKKRSPFKVVIALTTFALASMVIGALGVRQLNKKNVLLTSSEINSLFGSNITSYYDSMSIYRQSYFTNNTISSIVTSMAELEENNVDTSKIDGYTTSYSKSISGYLTYDINTFGVDNDLIYPGNILRINSNDPLRSYGVNSGDITISTSMFTGTGNPDGISYMNVKNASLSTTREAIGKMVASNLTQESMFSQTYISSFTEIENIAEFNALLGLRPNIYLPSALNSMVMNIRRDLTNREITLGATKFDENDNVIERIVNNNQGKTFIAVSLTQEYYTVDMDSVYSPGELIRKDSNIDDIKDASLAGGSPGYISSVSYGKKAIVVMEIDGSYSDFMKVFDGTNDLEDLVNANISKYYSFIIGHSNNITETTLNKILEQFNGSYNPLEMVGTPISFRVRCLNRTNDLVPYGEIYTYYTKNIKES